METRELIVLGGPTASGKSSLAMALCEALGAQIVSCDSMQLYRGMDIGTAKPTPWEMACVQHHLIDVLEPDEPCSAAHYRSLCLPVLERLFASGVQPVLCGGTGLYINALTRPLGFSVQGDPAIRDELTAMLDQEGGKRALHELLCRIDPQSAERLHVNDVRRVIRAIEVFRLTGRTLTDQMRLDAQRQGDYPARIYALSWPREVLYNRIDMRVDQMVRQGLIEEVASLLDRVSATATAMQAIGYKEIACALKGDIPMSQAIERVKQGTRNYAKRQMTWFQRDDRVRWLSAQGRTPGSLVDEIMEDLHK